MHIIILCTYVENPVLIKHVCVYTCFLSADAPGRWVGWSHHSADIRQCQHTVQRACKWEAVRCTRLHSCLTGRIHRTGPSPAVSLECCQNVQCRVEQCLVALPPRLVVIITIMGRPEEVGELVCFLAGPG